MVLTCCLSNNNHPQQGQQHNNFKKKILNMFGELTIKNRHKRWIGNGEQTLSKKNRVMREEKNEKSWIGLGKAMGLGFDWRR